MKFTAAVLLVMVAGCSSAGSPSANATASPRIATTSPSPVLVDVPPPGAVATQGGCGGTQVFRNGSLPDWATVNAPKGAAYVIATPGLAVGYIFSFPLKAGLNANTKVLWYVGTPRGGQGLNAKGHPLGANQPVAEFTKAADSFPGEIYPTGPTVPTAGCWHFTLSWHGGDQHVDVDLLFNK